MKDRSVDKRLGARSDEYNPSEITPLTVDEVSFSFMSHIPATTCSDLPKRTISSLSWLGFLRSLCPVDYQLRGSKITADLRFKQAGKHFYGGCPCRTR